MLACLQPLYILGSDPNVRKEYYLCSVFDIIWKKFIYFLIYFRPCHKWSTQGAQVTYPQAASARRPVPSSLNSLQWCPLQNLRGQSPIITSMITTAILLSSIMEEWAEHCRMASIRPRLPQLELGLQAVLAVNIILIQVIIILQCTPCHVALLDILNPKEIGLSCIHFLGYNGPPPSKTLGCITHNFWVITDPLFYYLPLWL